MSTAAVPARPTSAVATGWQLARRSLLLTVRVPSTFFPSIVFPVVTTVAFSGAFSALTRLPGFGTDNMLNFMLPMSVIQGAAFAGVGVGMGLIRDLDTGFQDRMVLAPVSRWGLLVGPMISAVVRALVTAVLVLGGGLIGGADLTDGALGAVTLLVAAAGTALAASAWALGLALRIQNVQAGALMQMGIFAAVFLSTAQVPLSVMTGWLRSVARVNPMTNVFTLGRQGFIGDVTWAHTWPGLLAIAAAVAFFVVFAGRGLRRLVP